LKEFTPLITELAEGSAKTGEPIVRTMEYSFPTQGFEYTKDQFMLGEKILVAPILQKGQQKRKVLLPKGTWRTNTGKIIEGPKELTVRALLDELPYFSKV